MTSESLGAGLRLLELKRRKLANGRMRVSGYENEVIFEDETLAGYGL